MRSGFAVSQIFIGLHGNLLPESHIRINFGKLGPFLQAAIAGASEAKAENGVEPTRAATPPASTWVGQRRNLDQDMEAALESFTRETSKTRGRKSIGQRVSPLLRHARDLHAA